jgi:hypothetical protein
MSDWPSDAELAAADADFQAAEAEADLPERDDHDDYDDGDPGERFGFGVCARGTCIEPCGPNGGCNFGSRRRR